MDYLRSGREQDIPGLVHTEWLRWEIPASETKVYSNSVMVSKQDMLILWLMVMQN